MSDWVYDIETYSNIFTLAVESADSPLKFAFEVSDWQNDTSDIIAFMDLLIQGNHRMVGFNNIGFDYPVIHMLYRMRQATAKALYDKAMAIINAPHNDRFAHQVFLNDRVVPQIDLFKIHHFDNMARATSLKALEFNMRSESLQDLPFKVGTALTRDQAIMLKKYNAHDVSETKKFYTHSLDMIRFRESLCTKYGPKKDWLNYSDVKIGTVIFETALESKGVQLYNYGTAGRTPRQTKRPSIKLTDCIPPYITFEQPEFNRILNHLRGQTITETKGVFKGLDASVGGLKYVFGTGGLHASIENEVVLADAEYDIIDVDCTSMYPSIVIANQFAPAHLGPVFVSTYSEIKAERMRHTKGTVENAAYKLALNGTYGKTNDKFSVFFDPKTTMSITLTGQLILAMLAERLNAIQGVRVLQANTDGVTSRVPKHKADEFKAVCGQWEKDTMMTLEWAHYRFMALADVNSYIAVSTDGKVKRKGRYEHEVDWHQNHSSLVVSKVAELVLVDGLPIRETIKNWPDRMDFMLRVKVPRSGCLTYTDPWMPENHISEQNTTRYYIAKDGVSLWKWLPPLKGKTDWRKFSINAGWRVQVCNNMSDAKLPIDFDFYVQEVEKLCLRMK